MSATNNGVRDNTIDNTTEDDTGDNFEITRTANTGENDNGNDNAPLQSMISSHEEVISSSSNLGMMSPPSSTASPSPNSRVRTPSFHDAARKVSNLWNSDNNLISLNTIRFDDAMHAIARKQDEQGKDLERLHKLEEEQERVMKQMRVLEKQRVSEEKLREISAGGEEKGEGDLEESDSDSDSDSKVTEKGNKGNVARKSKRKLEKKRSRRKAQFTALDRAAFASDDDSDEVFLSEMRQNRRELVGLRAIVKQLQLEQDKDDAQFLESDHRLQSLKVELMKTRKELSTSLTKSDLAKLQNSLSNNKKEVLASISESQSAFTRRIDTRVQDDLAKLTAWFTEHDELATRRQNALDKKFGSCARANELEELRENLEQDASALTSKVAKATKALKEAMLNIKRGKEEQTMRNLNKRVISFFRNLQSTAFKTWYKNLQKMKDSQRKAQLQYSCMMKIVAKQNCGLVRFGMAKWKKYTMMHRQAEIDQARGVTILKRTISRILLAPQEVGFHHWHRIMMLKKEESMHARERAARCMSVSSLDAKQTGKLSNLGDIMGTFHNDIQGGMEVLTRELMRLKDEDLAELRKDWMLEKMRTSKESSDTLNGALDDISKRAELFENQISSKLQLLAQEIPVMRKTISAEGRKLAMFGKKSEEVDMKADKNKANIDSLLLNAGRMETRVFDLEVSRAV